MRAQTESKINGMNALMAFPMLQILAKKRVFPSLSLVRSNSGYFSKFLYENQQQ